MALVNNKKMIKVIWKIEKDLGRPLTNRELYAIYHGDNSVLSKKNREEGKK